MESETDCPKCGKVTRFENVQEMGRRELGKCTVTVDCHCEGCETVTQTLTFVLESIEVA